LKKKKKRKKGLGSHPSSPAKHGLESNHCPFILHQFFHFLFVYF